MEKTQLDSIADILVTAYLGTASYSQRFRTEYEHPPTQACKVHHIRSIAQAQVIDHDRLVLAEPYVEFGRVEILDRDTDCRYLLRSEGAVTIERNKGRQRESLFDSARYLRTEVILLVYGFHKAGLVLSVAGTEHQVGRKRLEASGPPTYVATWPYSTASPRFDQGAGDPFAELGEMPDNGEEEVGGKE